MDTRELARFRVFKRMSPDELEKIANISETVTINSGDALFKEGDRSDYLYLILSGRVSLRMSIPNQKQFVISTLEPGEEAGWSAMRENKPYTAAGYAVGDVEAIRVSGEKLVHLFQENPGMGYATYRGLLGVVADRVKEARIRIANLVHG